MVSADLEGRALQRARKSYHLSLAKLAKAAGVNVNYASLIELGYRRNDDELARLNQALFSHALQLLKQRHADASGD
jgi:transcriptional regulator with XRE-family HTH domain